AADPRSDERALCLAAPYAAAVLARMGLAVTAQETDAAVFDVVGAALADEGVTTVVAPLTAPQGDGWDLIVSEMAVPVRPDAWLSALRDGGRLVVVERSGPVGKAVLYVKGQDDAVSRKVLFDSAPPVLAELAPAPTFAL
ncbi:MAG: protein-L-isoaspartate O-methyltransferase, partial [Caulobacterales bacterium]|nr:protein-L-isoaspartate O-methyltransferase [Caulobacterales bacterium]